MRSTYTVQGMRCQKCVARLTQALQKVSGVHHVTVTLDPPRAEVEMGGSVSAEALRRAARDAGEYVLQEGSSIGSRPRADATPAGSDESLLPLFVVVAYIVGGVFLRAAISNDWSIHTVMGNFMGGCFVVFSLFKLMNLQGFADGFATYDVLARRSRRYALAYPFLELILGVAYFVGIAPLVTNIATLVLMGIGSIGVAQALRQNRKIQCACLGTVLKLPMTKVTLAEDVVMGAMAFAMLFV